MGRRIALWLALAAALGGSTYRLMSAFAHATYHVMPTASVFIRTTPTVIRSSMLSVHAFCR